MKTKALMRLFNKSFLLIATIGLIFTFVGCAKKCKLGPNVTSGDIKTNAVLYPKAGYLSEQLNETNYLIRASHPYAERYEVSYDGGATKGPVNYNEFSIICYPTRVSCYAQFTKDVTIDHVSGIVKFKLHVQECGSCDETRYVENYTLIPAVPDSYEVIYDVKIIPG